MIDWVLVVGVCKIRGWISLIFFGSRVLKVCKKCLIMDTKTHTLTHDQPRFMVWTLAVMLWTWMVVRKVRLQQQQGPARSWITVLAMGIILALLDAHVVYDQLVSKTRRLVSIDVVRSHLTHTLGHHLALLWIGHVLFTAAEQQSQYPSQDLATLVGLVFGFSVAAMVLARRHAKSLRA